MKYHYFRFSFYQMNTFDSIIFLWINKQMGTIKTQLNFFNSLNSTIHKVPLYQEASKLIKSNGILITFLMDFNATRNSTIKWVIKGATNSSP